MAEENIKTTLQFQADITDFKAAMSEAKDQIKLANSEFSKASSSMDDWSKSTDGLQAKIEQLTAVEEAERRKLAVLESAYADVVKKQGETSAEAVKLKTEINNQQAVVNKTVKAHDKFAAQLEEVERGAEGADDALEKAGKAAKEAGDAAKESGEGWTIAKDVIADMISNVISGAVDTLLSAAEATREYRREMAQMAQNAKDSGQSMEDMKRVLSDVSAVTGETDAAMEGLNMLMATGLDTAGIELAADALSGAATKFDGLKFEGIAEGLQETLATGTAVGPFAELIERTGGNLESFNEGLANCTTAAEQQQYVLKWLSESGLKGVHDAYVQNNADLVAAEQAQFRLNDSMAGIGAVLEPIQTGLQNLAATVLEQITPVIQSIVQWTIDNLPVIAPIVGGIAAALGVLAGALAISSLISGVQKAFALLNATMLANPFVLIVALIAGLVAAFIGLWNNCEGFRNFFIKLWENIKKAVSSAKDSIVKTFDSVISWIKGLPGKIGSAISGAIQTVKTWGTNLYNTAKNSISNLITNIFNWFKALPGKISSAISGAVDAIATWGRNLLSKGKDAASNLVSAVVDGVKGLPGKMLSVGSDLVAGLWEGISGSYTWIKNKITGWVGNVTSFIKNLFGINSPSTLMRDEVGKMLGLGMAEGIEQSRSAVNSAVRTLGNAAMGGLSSGIGQTSGGTVATGGKTIILNQTNNSPRALSRLEIYRQTHNALAYAGGV